MTKTNSTVIPTLAVGRKSLLAALTRLCCVAPKNPIKPVLAGVRLEGLDGKLRLAASDLELGLLINVESQGGLPPCVVSCEELTRRLKAGKSDLCTLSLDTKGEYMAVNGGQVDHRLATLDLAEFPPVSSQPEGQRLTLDGQKAKEMLTIADVAAAQESTRYAINGILLEADKKGARLVATDGRRLVVTELGPATGDFRGQVILPRQIASLVGKLITKKSGEPLEVFIKPNTNRKGENEPADLYLVSDDWALACREIEGRFPSYREIVPDSHSRFVVDREAMIDALKEVALASNEFQRGVRLHLGHDAICLSAGSAESGEATGSVPCTFGGGGDSSVVTGFNPDLLLDALKHVPGDRAVIDVAQNRLGELDGNVHGAPALVYGLDHPEICWVLMPINVGLEVTRDCLGSNYPEPRQPEKKLEEVPTLPVRRRRRSQTETPAEAIPCSTAKRNGQHTWPEIGTVLEASYRDQVYSAVITNAPNLKSGRAIQVTSGPAAGQVFRSPTGAMDAATYTQREKLGLVKSKKGLPASGWDFWIPAKRKPATA